MTVPVSFVTGIGSSSVVQNTRGLHHRSFSTIAGVGGSSPDRDANGNPTGVDKHPWTYHNREFGNSETYIKRDGQFLVLAETLSRLLHPRLVLEAEDADLWSMAGALSVEDNDDPQAGRFNGGESVVDLDVGDWLEHGFPPPAAPGDTAATRTYHLRLRLANADPGGGTQSVDVLITQGSSTVFQGMLSVPATGARHEYVLVEAPQTLSLDPGAPAKLRVTFLGADLSYDAAVVVQRL